MENRDRHNGTSTEGVARSASSRGSALGALGVLTALAAGVAGAACVGNIGDSSNKGASPPTSSQFSPPTPTMRRLLTRQYINSVHDLLGDAAALAAVAPPDEAINGFDEIGASQRNVGDEGVKTYEQSCRDAAGAAVAAHSGIAPYLTCTPSGAHDADCYATFIKSFGHVAFRRPLTDDEVTDFAHIADLAATAYGSFDDGLKYAIATMLESPSFIYQVETGVADGSGLRKLTGPELATRMSFFLLDTTPSLDLLTKAESGALDSSDGARAAAEEMVADPRSHAAIRALYDEVLSVRDVVNTDKVTKNPALYPSFTPALASAMREETLRLVDDLVWTRDADFRELVTADYTFVNGDLAALYGYTLTGSDPWQKVSIPDGQPRAGFLGQASYLATNAHIEKTSPTLRGKFVRERLLCQSINPPPSNVKTEFPPDTGATTMRDRLKEHQTNPSCAGCHTLMDNIGLGLENFDTVGQYRDKENGIAIDASGDFDDKGHFDDGAGFARLLADDPDFAACIVKNVYRASLGHIETDGEAKMVNQLATDFSGAGYRLQDLMVNLVAGDAFRWVGEVQ